MRFKNLKVNKKLVACVLGLTLMTTGCSTTINNDTVNIINITNPSTNESNDVHVNVQETTAPTNKRNKIPVVTEILGISEEYLNNEKSELMIAEFASAYGTYTEEDDIQVLDNKDSSKTIELGEYSYNTVVFSLRYGSRVDYDLSYMLSPVYEGCIIDSHLREIKLVNGNALTHERITYKEKDNYYRYSDMVESYNEEDDIMPETCQIVISEKEDCQIVITKNGSTYLISKVSDIDEDSIAYELGWAEFNGIRELVKEENENIFKQASYLYDFAKEKGLNKCQEDSTYYDALKFFSDLLKSFEFEEVIDFQKKLN